MKLSGFGGLVGVLYLSIALTIVGFGLRRVHDVCPLAKQGCNCGHICTRSFDCIRGDHK